MTVVMRVMIVRRRMVMLMMLMMLMMAKLEVVALCLQSWWNTTTTTTLMQVPHTCCGAAFHSLNVSITAAVVHVTVPVMTVMLLLLLLESGCKSSKHDKSGHIEGDAHCLSNRIRPYVVN
jgi:hypothetical protein